MHRAMQNRALRRCAALLLGSLAIHLGSAAPAKAEEPICNYAVPAQPSNGALTDFADQSNLKLMFPAELARGIASPGVSGALTRDQALARLLAGTGLTYRYTSPDTVTIERSDPLQDLVNEAKQPLRVAVEEKKKSPPHEADTPTVLEEMTVTASPIDDTSYNVPNATTATTKTNTPLIETPQSISVITRDQLDAQKAQSLNQALRYTPGVQSEQFGVDNVFDFFQIRGFRADANGLFRDGLQLNSGTGFAAFRLEPYGAERIEVLRGPAAVLYGQTGPGGLVNFVTKQPTQEPFRELEFEAGNFDLLQGKFDLSGPITEGGRLRAVQYRLTGLVRDSETQVDFEQNDRFFLAPALTWRPTADTTLTLLSQYQDDTVGHLQFLPSEGTVLGNPNGRIPIPLRWRAGVQQVRQGTVFRWLSVRAPLR